MDFCSLSVEEYSWTGHVPFESLVEMVSIVRSIGSWGLVDVAGTKFSGHSASDWCKNDGPFHQRLCFSSSLGVKPLDAQSAGLISVGIYLHSMPAALMSWSQVAT